jgi:hypothetical protein
LYLAQGVFDDFAELRPFGEIFEVEAYVVGFREVVEVTGVEVEEVDNCHGADERHPDFRRWNS